MSLIRDSPLDKLTPARVWASADVETRRVAARCLYADTEAVAARVEADAAVAAALRFRGTAIRRLPLGKRVDHLSRLGRVEESLATALLRTLHLSERREMLGAFLDALGIPQSDGVIETEVTLPPPSVEALRKAVEELRGRFPEADVDLYLATLLAMDPEFWVGLADAVRSGA